MMFCRCTHKGCRAPSSATAAFIALLVRCGTTDVAVPVSENTVAVQLTAAALANSPLLRNGPLRGQTINVDIGQTGTYNGLGLVGTPLADAAGYANLIQRSVGELTAAGGTVKIAAGESVVMQAGSSINVSGGWINYQGGGCSGHPTHRGRENLFAGPSYTRSGLSEYGDSYGI